MFRGTSGKISGGFVFACLLVGSALPVSGGIDTSTPISFFTNLASRLLQSELGLSLSRIQIYPTNQYTPAVHRLLQVTANIYDATTNRTDTGYPYLPSVFRPLFQKAGTNIFISGYQEVPGIVSGGPYFDYPVEAKDLAENLAVPDGLIDPRTNVYNVPWIVGAKKGLPNFNEFAMQNAISVARRLEFRHLIPNGDPDSPANPVAFTNQLFSIGISNAFGIEAWNSYSSTYPRDLLMGARTEITLAFYGTNYNTAFGHTNVLTLVTVTNIAANTWVGITNTSQGSMVYRPTSFTIPVETNFTFYQTNVGFIQSAAGFDGVRADRMLNLGNLFPVPRWWVKLNWRVRYFLLDDTNLVDYVSLSRDEEAVDVTLKLMEGASPGAALDGSAGGAWNTNRVNNLPSDSVTTKGIVNQIMTAIGPELMSPAPDWNSYKFDTAAGQDVQKAIQFFKINMGQLTPTNNLNKSNVFFAPYVPFRTIYQHVTRQANDPLVHYTLPDLMALEDPSKNSADFAAGNPSLGDMRGVNYRYQPWGATFRGMRSPGQPNQFNPANKDPLVYQSDNWQFPTNLLDDLSQIGRVHRGTPWQTIYLKTPDISTNTWSKWTGNSDFADADCTRPVQDRHMASLFISLLNTNDPRLLFSANNPDTNAWLNVLNGFVVLTNNLSEAPLPGRPGGFDQLVMTSNSPQASFIASAVTAARDNQPNHLFCSLGDVLAVPELSVASPWLNSDVDQVLYGISEEAYEKIPSQLLLLLREDSIGSVITTNNQSLVQFTGYDDYPYAIQVSSNLTDWASVSTNYPVNGVFSLPITMPAGAEPQFYRSVLLP